MLACPPASNIAVTVTAKDCESPPLPAKKSQADKLPPPFTSSTNLVAAFREGKKKNSFTRKKKKKNLGPQILFLQPFSPPLPQTHNLSLSSPSTNLPLPGIFVAILQFSRLAPAEFPFAIYTADILYKKTPQAQQQKSSNRSFAFTVVHIFLRSPLPEHLRNATLPNPALLLDLPSTQPCYIVTRNTASTTSRTSLSCSPLLNSSTPVPPSAFSSPHFAQQEPPRQLHWTSLSRLSRHFWASQINLRLLTTIHT
ncbi:hypothetical protein LZ32DRAFT_216472 [Colletotrichum eremochloae]|nr:hypothetical protein LZ32DRAFT_216472 [Colletotrichum eremochloae]